MAKNKKPSTNEFIQRLGKVLSGEQFDFSRVSYKNSYSPVEIICKLHGSFKRTPDQLLHFNAGCSVCKDEEQRQRREVYFLSQCEERHGDFFDYSLIKFNDQLTKIEIICPLHGKFLTTPTTHIRKTGGGGCHECGKEVSANKRTKRIIKNGLLKCSFCKKMLPISSFSKSKHKKSGHVSHCKDCIKANLKPWKDRREAQLKRIYGIDADDYDRFLSQQNSRCAICKEPYTGRTDTSFFAVDHCHQTGRVRGLLCTNCNLGLGNFQDNILTLRKAISYLSKNH